MKSKKAENKDNNSKLQGLYGIDMNSKFNFDYSKGLFWQVLKTEWTFEEYT